MLNTTQTTATPIMAMQQTAKVMVFDIETTCAPLDAVENSIDNWKPPANVKDETKIEAKRAEMVLKKHDKAALLDASPIICIACKTDYNAVIFSGMPQTGVDINQWQVIECENEREMLISFRTWADSIIDCETLIAGHNVKHFDLPKVRNAFIRHRLKLPLCLTPALRGEISCEVVDTMALAKAFTMEFHNDLFISLDKLAGILNIPKHKLAMSGADVPKAHARGEYAPILAYCVLDVESTYQAAALMLNIAPNLQ
jgi:hypothetical protein